jgi:hypothetical protein
MMRRAFVTPSVLAAAGTTSSEQRRFQRLASMAETLKPAPGTTAGTLNVVNEISVNADADEERKRPIWRKEVMPKRAEHSHLATMYKWGYNSLTLFKKVNEDPGQWWNANSSTLTSNWAQIGDYAACGLWSGVWRFTYGQGQYNMKPGEFRAHAYGRKDKNGAIHIDYNETVTVEEKIVAPHLPEHQKHRRYKNPDLPGFKATEPVKAKRLEREVQWHLGQGLRMYLVDGYFGSHPATSTIFRMITDNADHAYAVSMYAHRQSNIHSFREMPLLKRLGVSPMDEWSWRRPGVLMLHCPGYAFEAPRIVEEFGGPRPADIGISSPKFQYFDPYSIPMRACISNPSTSSVIDGLAYLCARWAYYADDKEHLTIPGEALLSADGSELTLFVDSTGEFDMGDIRGSASLFGSRAFRLANGVLSRGWDAVELPSAGAATKEFDFVEDSLGKIHRPLPLVLNGGDNVQALSHRFHPKRRSIANFGYKRPHNYSDDASARAAGAGMLFKPNGAALIGRPSAFYSRAVNIVVIGDKGAKSDHASLSAGIVGAVNKAGYLYADSEPLAESFNKILPTLKSVGTATAEEAKKLVEKLTKSDKDRSSSRNDRDDSDKKKQSSSRDDDNDKSRRNSKH